MNHKQLTASALARLQRRLGYTTGRFNIIAAQLEQSFMCPDSMDFYREPHANEPDLLCLHYGSTRIFLHCRYDPVIGLTITSQAAAPLTIIPVTYSFVLFPPPFTWFFRLFLFKSIS